MKKALALQIEEIGGDRYPDRKAAQDATLPFLSESFQAVIRDLLARGVLVNVNGKIIPNPTQAAPRPKLFPQKRRRGDLGYSRPQS